MLRKLPFYSFSPPEWDVNEVLADTVCKTIYVKNEISRSLISYATSTFPCKESCRQS